MIYIDPKEIVEKFEESMDPGQICRLYGFKTSRELGTFMKVRGYIWDPQSNNYSSSREKPVDRALKEAIDPREDMGIDKYRDILELLYENKDNLFKLLENTTSNCKPRTRYIARNINIGKNLNRLLEEYAQENKVREDKVVEKALVEYLESRGYKYRP